MHFLTLSFSFSFSLSFSRVYPLFSLSHGSCCRFELPINLVIECELRFVRVMRVSQVAGEAERIATARAAARQQELRVWVESIIDERLESLRPSIRRINTRLDTEAKHREALQVNINATRCNRASFQDSTGSGSGMVHARVVVQPAAWDEERNQLVPAELCSPPKLQCRRKKSITLTAFRRLTRSELSAILHFYGLSIPAGRGRGRPSRADLNKEVRQYLEELLSS